MARESDENTQTQELILRIAALEGKAGMQAESLRKCETGIQNIQSLMAKREEQYAARDAEVAELRAATKKVHALPIVAVCLAGLACALGLASLILLLASRPA